MKIFLVLTALLLLLMLIPVRAAFFTEPCFTAEIKYLFFKKRLFPIEKGKRDKKPKKTKSRKASEKKHGSKSRSPMLTKKQMISLLPKAYKRMLPPIKRLLKRTTIARLSLKMTVCGEDAAETAVKFGRMNAAVVNAVSIVDKIFSLKVKEIDIIPDFESCESSFKASGELRLIPLAALAAAVSLAANALCLLLPVLAEKRKAHAEKSSVGKEENDGKEESAGRCA